MRKGNMTGHRPYDGYVKSSISDGGGNCVLVRRRADDLSIYIRDSKYQRNPNVRREDEPIIEMPASAWGPFEALVLDGVAVENAIGYPQIEHAPDGGVVLRGADDTALTFTASEWQAFTHGLRDGEFGLKSIAA